MDHDDPLDRLAAEERDWAERARRIERQTAREARAARRRRPRIGSGNRVPRPPRVHSGGGISWIFLALVALTLAGGAALWTGVGSPGPIAFGFVLAGWLVSLCLHEFSHALTAHRGGDDTVAGKGYLRLDPRRYGHPVLTLLLPLLFLIAGGIPLPGRRSTSGSRRCCWWWSRSPARPSSTR